VGTSTGAPISVGDLPIGQKFKVTAHLDGYEPAELIAEPGKDQPAAVTLALVPHASVMSIDSDPSGATVLVDGEEKGVTPISLTTLPPGSDHEVTLRKVGYADLVKKIHVPPPGRESSVSWSLAISPDFGSVRLSSTPPGAQIYQNGELLAGVTTPVKELIVQAGKPYAFTLKLDGYQPLTLPVMVERGERDKAVDGTLVTGGALSVDTTIPDVRVTVVGQAACTDRPAPMTDCPLAKGKYTIKLTSSKLQLSEQLDVQITGGDVHKTVPLGIVEAEGDGVLIQAGHKQYPRVALKEGRQTVVLVNKAGESTKKQVTVTAGQTVKIAP
jgi:hypothetical protein